VTPASLHPSRPGVPPAVVACGLTLSLACAAGLGVLARWDRLLSVRLGMVAAGVIALCSGIAVIVVACRRGAQQGAQQERPRALLGLAVAVWGAGQSLLSLQIASDGRRMIGAGDAVSTLSVPVLVLAMLTLPRRSRSATPALRVALDALLVTSTSTTVIWWWLLQPALPDPAHPGGSAVPVVLAAALDLGCAAMAAMVWARDGREGGAAVTIGLVLQAVADVTSLVDIAAGRALPWEPGAIWCVGMPILAVGLARYAVAPTTDGSENLLEELGESRSAMIASVWGLLVLSVALVVPVPHRWTAVGLVPFGLSVVLWGVREAVSGHVRNRMTRWLAAEALRDVLTGLPNRSALTARIRALDLSRPWVLLSIDLDGFKDVNEELGPQAGDDLIVLVGRALLAEARPPCLVARTDGDEFGILVPGTVDDGEELAERLLDAVHRAVHAGGAGVPLALSIGIGRVTAEATDADHAADRAADRAADAAEGPLGEAAPGEHSGRLDALLEAQAALQAAKASGRDRVARYPGDVEVARRRRLDLERRLRAALAAGSLDMHAQPLVDLRSGRVVGFESLARWTDAVLGPVSPAEFVPVAEQTGLVTALGEFALRNSLLQARTGGIVGTECEIGINVSPLQLRQPSFVSLVVDVVAELRMSPAQLLLEVTEAILVAEDDPAAGALARLAEAGVQLAIDDFGTGYSALGYLRRLPVDVLKIDRSWVVAAVTEPRTRDVVGGVVSLAHTLGATVVVEGVEDVETARVCADLGADVGQGWLFGRPVPWPVASQEYAAAPVRAFVTEWAVPPAGGSDQLSTPAGRPVATS